MKANVFVLFLVIVEIFTGPEECRTLSESQLLCKFEVRDEVYGCFLINLAIKDPSPSPITITGQHLPGKIDSDVEFLTILNSEIHFIPHEIFTTFENLGSFEIWNSKLMKIKNFSKCEKITKLQFSDCQLDQIDESVFSECRNLERLHLSYNRLDKLNPSMLDGLSNLKYLDLYANELTRLSPQLFRNTPNIQKIDFGANKIDEIHPATFRDLINLDSVWFDANICVNRSFSFLVPGHIESMKDEIQNCFAL